MYCTECGTKNEDGMQFCVQCGHHWIQPRLIYLVNLLSQLSLRLAIDCAMSLQPGGADNPKSVRESLWQR